MSEVLFSAVQFDDYSLIRLNINCSNIAYDKNAEISSVELSLNINEPDIYNVDGRKALPVNLSISCLLHSSLDEDEQAKELAQMEYSGRVGVSAYFDDEMPDDECKRLLLSNGVSYLYAKARTYFELITAQSLLSSFSLPGIDPSRMFSGDNLE